MVEFMKRVARTKPKMELEERNLLSVAYKNVVSARRASLRVISSIEAREQEKGVGSSLLPNIAAYRSSVEDELQAICNDVLTLIDDYCLENAPETEPDSHVFYQKMKADYYRYLAEFTTGAVQAGVASSPQPQPLTLNPNPYPNPNQADVASKAEKAYELASNVAVHTLEPSPSHSP
tara:strand:+ start:135 stop:665 length:531 start_codon:yes stop_codon:yes gene_type:complete